MNYKRVLELRQRSRHANARVYSAYTRELRHKRNMKRLSSVLIGMVIVLAYLLVSNLDYRQQTKDINQEQQTEAAHYADARTWYHEQCDLDVDKVVCTPNTELQQ